LAGLPTKRHPLEKALLRKRTKGREGVRNPTNTCHGLSTPPDGEAWAGEGKKGKRERYISLCEVYLEEKMLKEKCY